MIIKVRGWIAWGMAFSLTILTLGRVDLRWDGQTGTFKRNNEPTEDVAQPPG